MISGEFETRRDAELAVEHLVQELRIERRDISVQAKGTANSAGSDAAGADVESGHPGVAKHGDPELNDVIEVSVHCSGDDAEKVSGALEAAGGRSITSN